MRTFSVVYPQFWDGKTGKEFRKLGAETQVVALYLITCRHAHMSGVYYIPKQTIAYETGQTKKSVDSVLKKLTAAGFAFYDETSEYIWVKEMLSWQVKELNPKDHRVTGIVRYCNSLPFVSFIEQFYDRYYSFLPGLKDLQSPLQAPTEDLRRGTMEGLPSPVYTVPVPDPVLSPKGESVKGENLERAHGEFNSVKLTEPQYEKLCDKFGKVNTDIVIAKLDRYSQTNPTKFRGYRSHYATVQTWHDMAVSRGEIRPRASPAKPTEEEIAREHEAMFGGRKKVT